MHITFTDLAGYIASLLVVLSFVMKDVKKIRIINFFGCAFFVLYGVLAGNGEVDKMLWPIIIPNLVLCGIQIFHIIKHD